MADRRPIAARNTSWARRIAQMLVRSNISPNQISVCSVVFAVLGAACLYYGPSVGLLLLTVVFTQLRLLCNLFDGMVAIEGGKESAVGALYNEFPDRLADTVLIVALGYVCGAPVVGWLGAVFALSTAYIRQTGAGLGFGHDFQGPLAKQQRMFVLSIGCVVGAIEWSVVGSVHALLITSGIIMAGSALTCVTRTWALSDKLKEST